MRHDAINSEEYRGYVIKIYHGEDCSSPRENDNLGTIATWHRRYRLGDVQPSEDPTEYQASLPKGSIILPVYMYEHGGIALSTGRGGQFSDPWDSGQLGFIYCVPEKVRKEYSCKRITAKVRAQVEKVLQAEIDEYSMYVGGECYGYVIEDLDGEQIDSCWGFIGGAWVRQAAREAADWEADRRDKANAEQREMYDDG